MATKIAPSIEKPKAFNLRPDETPLHNDLYQLHRADLNLRERLVAGRPIQYEPKRQNRFILHFPDQLDIPAWAVMAVDKPSVRMDEEINYRHNNNYTPQRYQWNDIRVKLRDPINPSTTQALYESLQDDLLHLTNLEFKLEAIGPVADIVEVWRIIGSVRSVSFGEYNYASDELSEIEMVIRPDRCILMN